MKLKEIKFPNVYAASGTLTERIKEMRKIGIKLPIKGSGGIMSAKDVIKMKEAGASGIEFATAAMLRPWKVAEIITTAEKEFK